MNYEPERPIDMYRKMRKFYRYMAALDLFSLTLNIVAATLFFKLGDFPLNLLGLFSVVWTVVSGVSFLRSLDRVADFKERIAEAERRGDV